MNTKPITEYDYFELASLVKFHGSGRNAAAALGIPRTTFQDHFAKLKAEVFRDKIIVNPIRLTPEKPVTRFIFSSAQDGTNVHKQFMANLITYAEYMDAEIHIAGYTYNKRLFEDHAKDPEYDHTVWYADEVRPYISNERIEIGDGIIFCGEMNTLPTAVSPLSGFESYTGGKWGIFPHAKVQLLSIATQKHLPSKIIMTTGTVTLPNYVPKKAGIKAEFHHIQAAVILEVMLDGTFFCRHLMANGDGSFQDLDIIVDKGELTFDNPVESVTHGDIHFEVLDEEIRDVVWNGPESVVDTLHPRFQVFHDSTDFRPRNHHRIMDPHHMYEMWINGIDSIEKDFEGIVDFFNYTYRDFSESIVVQSNHDLAFDRWLKTADFRLDPANAEIYLRTQLAYYQHIKNGSGKFNAFEWALRDIADRKGIDIPAKFLHEDDSFITCPDRRGGIENGMHGHLGPNGSRGNVRSFTKLGPRTNTAHNHHATIIDGAYSAGTYTKLDLGYNRGPSNWNHSFIVTYPSSKRTIVTISNGMWRAP